MLGFGTVPKNNCHCLKLDPPHLTGDDLVSHKLEPGTSFAACSQQFVMPNWKAAQPTQRKHGHWYRNYTA